MIHTNKGAFHVLINDLYTKISVITLLLIFCSLPGWAQHDGRINGKLSDSKQEGLAYSSVALQFADGRNFKGTLTDSLGYFSFSGIPLGTYQLAFSSMGMQHKLSPKFDLSSAQPVKSFKSVILETDEKLLNEVMISVQKNVIEQHPGKMTINVENSLLAEGNTALELLERAPGIKIDSEGKISLKGRSGVMVMINNKQTYLSAGELAVLLKGTNSSSISKIEILSQPSAKFDAAGNAGMINIVMKKNQLSGFNGSLNMNGGAGRKARYGSGFNVNYRASKINLYGNYNYAYRGETEYLDFIRQFNGGAETSVQRTETDEPLHTHNFRLGVDFELDTANSIGLLINGNVGKYLHDSQTSNRLSNNQQQLISDMLTNNYDQQNWQSFTYNLNYQHRFGKKDRLLTADLDYVPNRFNSDLNLDTYARPLEGTAEEFSSRRGSIPSKTNVYVAKVDYQDTFSDALKFETGLKTSYTEADNNLVYYQLAQDEWQYDETASNHFKYDEQIHAGYVNLHATAGKFILQGGIRAEYTLVKGDQVTTAQVFNRDYFQLFPNISVSNNLNESHQLQFAYGRRVERPNYGSLNPFRVFRDPSLYYEGNPYLMPERTQNLSLSHVYKSTWTTSINYSRTTDVITWVTGQIDATNTTFETPRNLPALVNYGISLTTQHRYFNWWSGTNFANLFRNEYDLSDEKRAMTSFSLNTQHSFKIAKGISAELNAYYNSKSVYGIIEENAYWAVSSALQKNVFGDKGSFKLAINDIFQTNNFRNNTKYQNINMNSRIWIDSRRAMLSFSYKFGKQIVKKERNTASEDLKKRMNN